MQNHMRRKSGLLGRGIALIIACLSTGCVIDRIPPVVIYTVPADRTGNFMVNGAITAGFTKPMDGASITSATFLVNNGITPIPGTVTCSGTTATFQPASSLPYNSTITATITATAKDNSGNALSTDHVWTFSTQSLVANAGLFYTSTFVPGPFTRWVAPGTLINGGNTLSQTANPDGSITLTINNAPGYEDNGFYFYVGSLKSFNSLHVTAAAGSGPFSANLYLDSSNDGEFFTWSPPNVFSSLGGDQYFGGPASAGNALTIDATTVFGGLYTLPQLRAGNLAGVNGNTIAGIWIGFSLGAGQSQVTTITSLQQQ